MRSTKIKKNCISSLCTCLHHNMVILRSQNKITDILMILAWACPFIELAFCTIIFMTKNIILKMNWYAIEINKNTKKVGIHVLYKCSNLTTVKWFNNKRITILFATVFNYYRISLILNITVQLIKFTTCWICCYTADNIKKNWLWHYKYMVCHFMAFSGWTAMSYIIRPMQYVIKNIISSVSTTDHCIS